MNEGFDYHEAFSRNLGWVTALELRLLRRKRVAIAGAGGVGGVHLLTLTRLGIGAFNIADMDVFEQANFNRQAGAMMSTLGKPKVGVMAAMARDINPELDIRVFPEGIGPSNYDDFLKGVDLYVDGLDVFAFAVRAAVFAACRRLGIPAITVAPLGMAAALVNFLPGKMSFDDYFGFTGASDQEKMARFLIGLSPWALHRHYLVDPQRVDLASQHSASTPMSCQLCAGVAASEALKILLGRGRVDAAPHAITYDAYLNREVRTWRPGGYRNPLNRLLTAVAMRFMARPHEAKPGAAAAAQGTLARILDLARWAQSGDNEQPWRFEALSEARLVVHFGSDRAYSIYDYDGRPSLMSLGCLVETLRLAASRFGRAMEWPYEASSGGGGLLHVDFAEAPGLLEDPLCDLVDVRSVDRRRYRLRRLTLRQKQTLTESLGEEFFVRWCEGTGERWRVSSVNSAACHLRLRLHETNLVHSRIIDWDKAYSPDRIPVLAIGASALTRPMMRWALADMRRVDFMGKLPGGTLASQWEMEVLPGMFCAAHFLLLRRNPPAAADRDDAAIRAGQALQRFWLTATGLGLAMHPSLATLCFAYYGRVGVSFSADGSALPQARRLAERFSRLCALHDAKPDEVVFMGRIGTPQALPLQSRSIRRPLPELMVK